ncbi:tyrosine-type recombinase/integrase [Roseibium sp.]|uniref:tyrosine-type recombinase/integrase n=1 Tax=Roseibium sp. TaxID=1936156 RepID=UPI003A975171
MPPSPHLVELLQAQREQRDLSESQLVFPSRKKKPMSDITLTTCLRDHKVASDTPGRIATAHGFRSSFRDWASENGYARDLAEQALAHTIKNATEAA